ncbi:MAG: hypothetical protein M1824_001457 [Vezdaea acicularis]|nr:MAG: hypothetical protein M1824_001457 [Vezdaea acicularis]
MNPHRKNKVDISTLSPDEQRLFRLYGKLPNQKDLLSQKLKERKYFDSGDYAMSKAGKSSEVGMSGLGTQHPLPENIPHLSSPTTGVNGQGQLQLGREGQVMQGQGGQSGSPVKEGSFLQRETSADEVGTPGEAAEGLEEVPKVETTKVEEKAQEVEAEPSVSPPPKTEGVPIRWQS